MLNKLRNWLSRPPHAPSSAGVWRCSCCGEEHEEPPTCFAAEAPWRGLVPEDEFRARVTLTNDECIVDDEVFFIRGHIEIPIHGSDESLAWSVWCSLSRESHTHMAERWESPARAGDRYFGWLSTRLSPYPETLNLKTTVVSRVPGVTPRIVVQEVDHPLFHDQERGISSARFHEIVHSLLHARDERS